MVYGQTSAASALLKAGAAVDARDEDGRGRPGERCRGGREAERGLVSDEFLCGLGFELLCLFGFFPECVAKGSRLTLGV